MNSELQVSHRTVDEVVILCPDVGNLFVGKYGICDPLGRVFQPAADKHRYFITHNVLDTHTQ